ncbi:MAG TPA: roadblock/LC7 domain-containing protein [Pilimelia sp.]|jgi:predicted regulator of Ras-like GTPase activity (Roadblock/LC7/MglB family)|nr:roadblock/LC7 domain-containing protein [Pilimelia sp.]
MSTPAPDISVDAQNFNWLLSRFAHETGGVIAAIAVSSDGLLIATSSALDRANADRLAAISSAMLSLAHGTSECHPLGPPDKVVVELAEGFLLVCTIGAGCLVGVLASNHTSLGTIAYETVLFIDRARSVLTPRLVEELKCTVGAGC